MRIQYPSNDMSMLKFLETAASQALVPDRDRDPINAQTAAEIQVLASDFKNQRNQLATARSQVKLHRDALRLEKQKLVSLARQAFQVVRNRAKEADFPKAYVKFFGLLQNANNPKTRNNFNQPIQLAQAILHANAELLDAGVTVLIDPSPERIQAVVDEALLLESLLQDALVIEQQLLREVRKLRRATNKMLSRIRFEITSTMEAFSKVEVRKVLRTFGFQYANAATDAVSGQDQPPAQDDQDGRPDTEDPQAGDGGSGEPQADNGDSEDPQAETGLAKTEVPQLEACPAKTAMQQVA